MINKFQAVNAKRLKMGIKFFFVFPKSSTEQNELSFGGTKMKLSTKIYLGFGSVLAITVLLSAISIYNMYKISDQSKLLAQEYIPEVIAANKVSNQTADVMLAIRSYGLSEHENYLKAGLDSITQTKTFIKSADELADKSTTLAKLKETSKAADTHLTEYEKMIGDTKKINDTAAQLRAELGEIGRNYIKTCNEYVEDQTKKFNNEVYHKASPKKLEDRLYKINEVNSLNEMVAGIRIAVWKAQAERNPAVLKDIMGNFDKMEKKAEALLAVSTDPVNIEKLKSISAATYKYKESMINLSKQWEEAEKIQTVRTGVVNKVVTATNEMVEDGVKSSDRVAQAAVSLVNQSLWILIFGSIIGVCIGAVLAYFITKGITLALNQTVEELGRGSGEISTASTQLSSAAQELASMSAEQASSIEETAASLEEMNGMVKRNVGNAEEAVELATKVEKISEQGNESMNKLQASMSEILESNKKIEELVKVIADIGEKTQVMDEIVFQTKLLSFNASVEAERAGEHGRGFAVVAQEVGNLAQMSGKSAQEIASIVSESIKSAEAITQDNKKKVEQGSTYAQEVANYLKEIMGSANTMAKGAEQVLTASKEQSSGIEQINMAMTQLDKATQTNAATAEETASTSEELTGQVAGVNRVVEGLVHLVHGASHYGDNPGYERPNNYHQPKQVFSKPTNVTSIRDFKKNPAPMKMAVGAPASSNGGDGWEKI